MTTRAGRLLASAVVVAAASAGCSSDPKSQAPDTAPATSTTVAPRQDDGVLQIGLLLPRSGAGAAIGESAQQAIELAVRQVNALGGIRGQQVKLLARSEGTTESEAALGLQQLIDAQVDAIIGPASSNDAIALVPTIVEAGIVTCSPTASALALDGVPDDGLFFRTIASDSLQADAIAEVVEQTGRSSAAIAYVDDGYGRPFESALRRSLINRGISVSDSVGFAIADDEYETEAERLVNSGDGALALIGDADGGTRMLAALATALGAQPRPIVVNDTLRQPWSQTLLDAIPAETRERVRGVSNPASLMAAELVGQFEDKAAGDIFATQAYDCANLIMLASLDSGSTQPAELANVMVDISAGGSACVSYADCAALLEQGRKIDYDGPSGRLTLNSAGDPASASYDEFGFDASGRDVSTPTVVPAETR